MKKIEWGYPDYIELRESYEVNNCICLKFRLGYFRIDYRGVEKDRDEMPNDFGKVDGVDMVVD